ncbi:MAG TPA: MFS transporter [Gemmatimonadales bacterium]|nr:MFS transporter [Gemmatimonadales bacterium]
MSTSIASTASALPRAAALRLRSTFAALRHRNYRLFLIGQFISLCGTLMQQVALGWLVLELTNSPFAVGLVTSLGSLPILALTLYGGVVADRVDKRRFVLLLQSLMLVEALTLSVLTAFHWVTVHWIMALAAFAGLLSAFEVPTRQAMVVDLVEREDLMNAIALNSSAFNVARVIGPAIAGALIAAAGLAACFFANAASYLAVVAGLVAMKTEAPAAGARPDTLAAMKEGFRYVLDNRWPRALVVLIAGFAVFGFPFMTMAPVFARDVLHVGASGYAALISAIGVGAAAGALGLAGFGKRYRKEKLLMMASSLFGVVLALIAVAHTFSTSLALFTIAGWTMAANGILGNTLLQIQAPDHLRGRVMGVYSFLVLGLAPFGSLQAGLVSEHLGVRYSIGLGGAACCLTVAWVAWYLGKSRPAVGQAGGSGREQAGADGTRREQAAEETPLPPAPARSRPVT